MWRKFRRESCSAEIPPHIALPHKISLANSAMPLAPKDKLETNEFFLPRRENVFIVGNISSSTRDPVRVQRDVS